MSLHEINILNDLNRELLMLIERCVIFTDYISVNNYGCLLQPINLNEEKKYNTLNIFSFQAIQKIN